MGFLYKRAKFTKELHVAVHLRDLTFTQDGNTDIVYGKLINYEKLQLFGKQIFELLRFQTLRYELEKDIETFMFLLRLRHLEEEDLYAQSIAIEPPASASLIDDLMPGSDSSENSEKLTPKSLRRASRIARVSTLEPNPSKPSVNLDDTKDLHHSADESTIISARGTTKKKKKKRVTLRRATTVANLVG